MATEAQDFFANWVRYKDDPWAFLTECCYTLDQVDGKTPIKLLPQRDYAKTYVHLWQHFPLIAIPKSRRMTMSWYTIALYTWDTLFHDGRLNAFVSKKEEDAAELVNRAKFILDHIPTHRIPREMLPEYNATYCKLDIPSINSKIEAYAQGADQLRQFTFSGIFGDECAFWEQAKAFYSASFPTIEGGGKMTLVSSPAPGFFKQLCFDAMDAKQDVNVDSIQIDAKQIMPGVRTWKNRKNKFLVLEVHYSADPNKRGDEFRNSIKDAMPLTDFLREYELHWDTFSGFPVYPEFSKLHLTLTEPFPQAGLPMLVGIDFGLTPAAIICQLQEDVLYVFEELVEINMGSDRFSTKLATHIKLHYPSHGDLKKNWLCFIDPAGLQRSQKDETSCAMSLMGVGFVPRPGPILFEERRKGVVHFLRLMTSQGPGLQLFSKGTPVLTKGFEGGYRYADATVEIEPNKIRPVKDHFSHPHDAFQYVACGVQEITAQLKKAIPRPQYGTHQERARHG